MTHVQSWTLVRNGKELERAGHTIYRRGDGEHHWSAVCSKCRQDRMDCMAADVVKRLHDAKYSGEKP